jgi:hypothetical protein
MKRKGERGSPYLSPLSGENLPKGLPFRMMEKEDEEMHSLIQLTQVGRKPSFSIIDKMKTHSILSKAFSISILRNMKPYFPLLNL